MLDPHPFPLGALPDSMQAEAPVAHEVVPALQGLAGWQVFPSAQATQVPLLQTLSVPHDIPLVTGVAPSAHPIDGEHTVVPVWQGLVGTQASPTEHATQTPPLQILPVPQEIPSFALPAS